MAGYQLCFFAAVHDTGVAVGTVAALGSAPAFAGFGGTRPGSAWMAATGLAAVGVALMALSGSAAEVSVPGVVLALGATRRTVIHRKARERPTRPVVAARWMGFDRRRRETYDRPTARPEGAHMLVAQHATRRAAPVAPSRMAPRAQPVARVGPGAPPRPPQNADPLSRTLARAVQRRARDLPEGSCCAACGAGGHASPCERETLVRPASGVPAATLQRAQEEGLIDSIWDKLGEAVDYVEDAIASTGAKIGTALSLAGYRSCEDALETPAVKPDPFGPWMDDKGLESLRNREGELLSKSKKPKGATAATLKLFKQALHAWGCERLGLDLLPKAGTSGPFGPETAAAVKQLQLFSGLGIDGDVGRETFAALDAYVGVRLPGDAASNVGGDDVQGKSSFQTRKNPVGRIYFPTNDYFMDAEDKGVLRVIADAATQTEDIHFEVIGYADKRDDAWYNEELSEARALNVWRTLDELLDERKVKYTIVVTALGEIERSQPEEGGALLKGYRRVDIRVTKLVRPPGPNRCTAFNCFEVKPEPEKKSCLEPATEWQAALDNLQVNGYVLTWTTGQVKIRMKRPDKNGLRWQYVYLYEGFGFGGDLELSSKLKPAKEASEWLPNESPIEEPLGSWGKKWFDFTTSKPIKITDFQGPARHFAASAALGPSGGPTRIRVQGPMSRGADEVQLEWTPQGVGIGVNASWDYEGELREYLGCRTV